MKRLSDDELARHRPRPLPPRKQYVGHRPGPRPRRSRAGTAGGAPLPVLCRTPTPRLCPACYGFWAEAGSLSGGVADERTDHPALRSAMLPRVCRACFAHLKPDGVCAKCKLPLPPLDCPAGHGVMQRFEQAGIQLDTCGACHATWFDASEIVAVYGLAPVPSLASWRVSQPDAGLLGSLLGQGAPVGVGSLTLGAALGILRAIR